MPDLNLHSKPYYAMPYCVRTKAHFTVNEIQEKVDRYHDYMLSKMPDGHNVYLSNVFEKGDLEKILTSNCDGVRVMLVKEENPEGVVQEQAKVSLLVVPVRKVKITSDTGKDDNDDFRFENMLDDSDNIIYVECPSKYCNSSAAKPNLI